MPRNPALKIPSVPEVLRNAVTRARMVRAELDLVLDPVLFKRDQPMFNALQQARQQAMALEEKLVAAMQPGGPLS
jgi:hypothetical protein